MEFFAGIWELICMLNSTFIRTRTAIDLASELDVILTTDSSYWLFNDSVVHNHLLVTDDYQEQTNFQNVNSVEEITNYIWLIPFIQL